MVSVIDFIEKLQKKPRHIRVQIMWASATVGAVIIFGFWLWSLSALLAQTAPQNNAGNDQLKKLGEIKKEMPGLWQSLSAGVGSVIDTVKSDVAVSPNPAPQDSPAQQSTEKLPLE
ncbi:MAG: hypothetical protein PHT44_00980 [Candidatus Portnoybacteria bacterium]|nr:hypothetical protein [Candidatus Portnoybacteria bacterium]MDD4982815.1 hypothetical protein [Candidatus Portnoybacteria bacterium]